jgi:hypothetical protein
MSQIYRQGQNWLIVNYFSDLDFVNPMLDEMYERNWAEYTSAKGPNSTQNYILNPSWMPDENLTVPNSWDAVSKKFQQVVQSELIHYGLMPMNWNKIVPKSAWVVSGDEGSYHTVHEHGAMNVCSVTYLKVPDQQTSPEGQIFFIMDSNPYNGLSVPATRVFHLQPQKNMVVIFPSWMLHGVYPQGKGLRQTLNIDFKGEEMSTADFDQAGSISFG